jgi:hypothetical protein
MGLPEKIEDDHAPVFVLVAGLAFRLGAAGGHGTVVDGQLQARAALLLAQSLLLLSLPDLLDNKRR